MSHSISGCQSFYWDDSIYQWLSIFLLMWVTISVVVCVSTGESLSVVNISTEVSHYSTGCQIFLLRWVTLSVIVNLSTEVSRSISGQSLYWGESLYQWLQYFYWGESLQQWLSIFLLMWVTISCQYSYWGDSLYQWLSIFLLRWVTLSAVVNISAEVSHYISGC
jgi:hypothetical protein